MPLVQSCPNPVLRVRESESTNTLEHAHDTPRRLPPRHRSGALQRRLEPSAASSTRFFCEPIARTPRSSGSTRAARSRIRGVKAVLHRRRRARSGLQIAAEHRHLSRQGRPGDPQAVPPRARDGTRALRRRAGRDDRRRHRGDRRRRARSDRHRVSRSARRRALRRRRTEGAPQLHDDVPGNLAFEFESGDADSGRGCIRAREVREQAHGRQPAPRRQRAGAARVPGRVRSARAAATRFTFRCRASAA